MKFLIWTGSFVLITIVNLLLSYATGYRAGYVVLYLLVFVISKNLCEKWDEHKSKKEKNKKPVEDAKCTSVAKETDEMEAYEDAAVTTDSKLLDNSELPLIKYCRRCGFELVEGSLYCSKCGNKIN